MPPAPRGRPINGQEATKLLTETFEKAETDFRENLPIEIPREVIADTERLFSSETQAYREALIGCAVARILDPEIDVRLPATESGETSFSGRGLADGVITPFMRSKAIPMSASPYLSSLRGGARFVAGGEPRIQRDQEGFDTLVRLVAYLVKGDGDNALIYLRYLLRCFVRLRESANIALKQIAKPNLGQLTALIQGMLSVKSGGRIPSLLAVAMFQTLSDCHQLDWQIEFQGINVADKASGAVGDITISKANKIILGVEVTERPIESSRVAAAFEQKVSPSGVVDYLFISTVNPDPAAVTTAQSYTAVGNEMNFVPLQAWLVHNLATVGPACRATFQAKMIALLSATGVPAELRVAWNKKMDEAIGVTRPT